MRKLVEDLQNQVSIIRQGGEAAAREKHIARGKLLPRVRVDRLLDQGYEWMSCLRYLNLSSFRKGFDQNRRSIIFMIECSDFD